MCPLDSSISLLLQLIKPSLRGQQGLSFFSVVIQDGFDKGFVGVRVRLFADQGSVEPQIHLFEEGMADIVHRVQEPRVVGFGGGIPIGHQAIGGRGIQMQFNFQITTIKIAKIVQGLHSEHDGSNARGRESVLDHPTPLPSNVGRGDREQFQRHVQARVRRRLDGRRCAAALFMGRASR